MATGKFGGKGKDAKVIVGGVSRIISAEELAGGVEVLYLPYTDGISTTEL